jgi:hypothetical protein
LPIVANDYHDQHNLDYHHNQHDNHCATDNDNHDQHRHYNIIDHDNDHNRAALHRDMHMALVR